MTRDTMSSKELKILASEKTNGSTTNGTVNGNVVINGSACVADHSTVDPENGETQDSCSTVELAKDERYLLRRNIYCVLCAVGIIVCFFVYGYIMERITRGCYGSIDDGGKCSTGSFKYAQTLSAVLFFFYWAAAKGILLFWPANVEDKTHYGYYMGCALSYLLAVVTSTKALEWVAYPTQVVAKSAKPIPVIILGKLIGKKSYTYQKYFFVVLIVIGVILFMYKDNKQNKDAHSFGWGEALLLFSLCMDGVLGAVEERIRHATAPSGLQMMSAINGWSTLFVAIPIVIMNEEVEFFKFASEYPRVLLDIGSLAIAGAMGQICIFTMVSMFGALACSLATTIRKVITLLFSVIFFKNILVTRQWLGAALVFGALFGDMIFRKKPQKNL